MLISHQREKLIQAIVFFARNTRHCGKIKLFKLLYLLDFEHFRQTGRSVTGLEYRAWKMGPAPTELWQEWDDPQPDFSAAIQIVPEPVVDYVRERAVPKVEFTDDHFTKRELQIMQMLAERFRDDLSKPMVNVTHVERGPWAAIWDDGRGSNERIPYSLALRDDDPNREPILEAAREYAAMAVMAQSPN
jgi:uncharacterized phage-associated protein